MFNKLEFTAKTVCFFLFQSAYNWKKKKEIKGDFSVACVKKGNNA